MSFGDGPPYSEDEDLHSPVVTSMRQRKKNSGSNANSITNEQPRGHSDRGTLVSVNADGSETYYVNGSDESENGPGGEYVTYPAHEGRYSHYVTQQEYAPDVGLQSPDGLSVEDRYTNDYQFAVG